MRQHCVNLAQVPILRLPKALPGRRALPFPADCSIERGEQPFGRKRLYQKIGRPGAHRADRRLDRAVRGQDQDRHVRAMAAQYADQFGNIVIRRARIDHDRVKTGAVIGIKDCKRRFRIIGMNRAPLPPRGNRSNQAALRRFIVNQHQQSLAVSRHAQILGCPIKGHP